VVHPGWVTSAHDGDRHLIGFGQLCELYGLDRRYAIDANSQRAEFDVRLLGARARHFFPREDGNYEKVTRQ
jgi:hypothetical protein